VRCGPVTHQQHGSAAADKLSEDETDVAGIHYGMFLTVMCSLVTRFNRIQGSMLVSLHFSCRVCLSALALPDPSLPIIFRVKLTCSHLQLSPSSTPACNCGCCMAVVYLSCCTVGPIICYCRQWMVAYCVCRVTTSSCKSSATSRIAVRESACVSSTIASTQTFIFTFTGHCMINLLT